MKKINIAILLTIGLLVSAPINEEQSLKVAKNIYKQFSPTNTIWSQKALLLFQRQINLFHV